MNLLAGIWIGLVAPTAASSWSCDRDDPQSGEACAAYREALIAWSRHSCAEVDGRVAKAVALADGWPAAERRERIGTLREAATECWHAEWARREQAFAADAYDACTATKSTSIDWVEHTGPDNRRGMEVCTRAHGTRDPCEAFATDAAPRHEFAAVTQPPPAPAGTDPDCLEFVSALRPMLHQPVDGAAGAVFFQWIDGRLHESVVLDDGLSVSVSHGGCGHWSVRWDFYRVDGGDPREQALELLGRVKQDYRDGTVGEPWLRRYLVAPDALDQQGTFACMEATTCWVTLRNGHLTIETDFAM